MEVTADLLRTAAQQLELGQSDLAERTLSAELGGPTCEGGVSHLLGLSYMRMGNLRAAATWFGDAIEAEPDNPVHHNDLGVAFFHMGRPWHAHAAFGRAIRIASNFSDAQENLTHLAPRINRSNVSLHEGLRALERGDLDQANVQANQCLSETPDQPNAQCILAKIALARNNRTEALEAIERALTEHPDFPEALALLDQASLGAATPIIALPNWRLRPPRVAKERPLVSVTLAAYNHAQFVKAAVESVLAQTYSPLEIIIADDASTDASASIIECCLARYEGPHRVRFIRRPSNLGSRGRNNWVELYRQTTGRFVVQFAGDDVMQPDMVECMVQVWRTGGVSLVAVNANYVDAQSNSLGRTHRDPQAADNDSLVALARDGTNHCVFGAGMGCDREVYETFPFSPNTPARVLGTIDIMFPFYAGLLNGCASIPTPLMQYRVHGAQTSLAVAHERAAGELSQLIVEERIWEGHLAHAIFMRETLDKLTRLAPARFGPLGKELEPALANQTFIMAKRQVEARHRLFYGHGIWDMAGGK